MSLPPASAAPPPADASAVKRTFWQRRVRDPIVALLTQGITPDRISATLAVGTLCSLFPFFGFTTMLNLGVGLWLRLNQPLLHTLNQLLGPIHVVMIFVYVRMGELVWGATEDRFTISEVITTFREASFLEFLERFGWAGVHAFTAWILTAPILLAGIYYPLRPVIRRLASLRARPSASS
jgi:uncharacterized protein (DUF2062 family)